MTNLVTRRRYSQQGLTGADASYRTKMQNGWPAGSA